MRAFYDTHHKDHACRFCCGENAMDNDFVCSMHQIEQWLSALSSPGAAEPSKE